MSLLGGLTCARGIGYYEEFEKTARRGWRVEHWRCAGVQPLV